MGKIKFGPSDMIISASVLPKSAEKQIITVMQEVPVEITKELVKEVQVEVIKEVPVEIIKEVIKEVPIEVIKEVEVIKEIEKIIEIPVIKVQERLVENTEKINKYKKELENLWLINVTLTDEKARAKAELKMREKQLMVASLVALLCGVLYGTNL